LAAPPVETLHGPVEAAPEVEGAEEAAVSDVPMEAEPDVTVPSDEVAPAPSVPLLSVDEAKAKLGPAILERLDHKFKGKVSGVRQPDARDHLF